MKDENNRSVGPSPEFVKFMEKTNELMKFMKSYNDASESFRAKHPEFFKDGNSDDKK